MQAVPVKEGRASGMSGGQKSGCRRGYFQKRKVLQESGGLRRNARKNVPQGGSPPRRPLQPYWFDHGDQRLPHDGILAADGPFPPAVFKLEGDRDSLGFFLFVETVFHRKKRRQAGLRSHGPAKAIRCNRRRKLRNG